MRKSNILIISDTHAPFHHPQTLEFLKAITAKYHFDHVVHIGDEIDMHTLSHYTTNPNGLSGEAEHVAALKFMRQLYRMFPNVKVCIANHTIRLLKKAMDAGIPKRFLKSFSEYMEAPPGWTWHSRIEIEGIVFEHGEGVRGSHAPALDVAKMNMKPSVIGHFHTHAGVQYYANREKLLWGLSVGCLIDTKTYAFEYDLVHRRKPMIGCGVIINGRPEFIPMLLDRRGRWNGVI